MAGGRPTSYKEEYVVQAYKYCLLGATDEELAAFFEVNVDTIYEWKKVYPEFSEALKEGKAKADAEVADKLRQRAEGFEWDELTPIKLKTVLYENGKRVSEVERAELVTVHKVVPPDPTSALFWLKNRRSQNWRDKTEIDHTNKGEKFEGTEITPAMLAATKAYEEAMKKAMLE